MPRIRTQETYLKEKEYRESHPEIYRQACRKWREDNRDKSRSYASEYAKNNRDVKNLSYERRKARLLGVGGSISREEWQSVLDYYDNKCLACGTTEELAIDHVIPLIEGGTNTIDNVQPLCRTCNSRKGTKTIDYRDKKGQSNERN